MPRTPQDVTERELELLQRLWDGGPATIRQLTAALYPGVGLLEMTNVSVGRGTDTPFEIFGAPYLDARAFAAALNDESLPGVRFIPVRLLRNCSGLLAGIARLQKLLPLIKIVERLLAGVALLIFGMIAVMSLIW